jgi:hypothetical protein
MHRREFLRGVALAGIATRARGLASSFAGGMQSNAGGLKKEAR